MGAAQLVPGGLGSGTVAVLVHLRLSVRGDVDDEARRASVSAQFPLEQFSGLIAGEFVDEHHTLGDLERSETIAGAVDDLLLGGLGIVLEDHDGGNRCWWCSGAVAGSRHVA